MRAGPAFDCEISCGVTPPRNAGATIVLAACPAIFRQVVPKERILPARMRAKISGGQSTTVFTQVRDSYDLRPATSSQIRARGEPAPGDKIFPPARLSARNSCQQRRAV